MFDGVGIDNIERTSTHLPSAESLESQFQHLWRVSLNWDVNNRTWQDTLSRTLHNQTNVSAENHFLSLEKLSTIPLHNNQAIAVDLEVKLEANLRAAISSRKPSNDVQTKGKWTENCTCWRKEHNASDDDRETFTKNRWNRRTWAIGMEIED